MKKIACINDLSGIGRCSLTASLPIISSLKIQCCPYPTAILSSQTGYDEYSFLDLKDEMIKYKSVWKNLNVEFDFIYSGFLGSMDQIKIVSNFIDENPNVPVLVDPILGDEGKLYPVFDEEMCKKIKELVKKSYIITPNLTEALLLTNKDLNNLDLDDVEILEICKTLSNLGPKKIIITGILRDDFVLNFGFNNETKKHFIIKKKYNKKSYSGTGDIFSSIISALTVRGFDLYKSVEIASDFIYDVIKYNTKFDTDRNDGIMFELFLNKLTCI
ncbi:MAG: pyridoxamine kinase [Peptostreptococcaceae bacterium]